MRVDEIGPGRLIAVLNEVALPCLKHWDHPDGLEPVIVIACQTEAEALEAVREVAKEPSPPSIRALP